MEFALSEDQRLLQDSLSGTLGQVSALDEVRKVADGDATVAEEISRALGEMGTVQLMIPEVYGGLGLGALDAALVQEAIGEHVSPASFLASAVLAVEAIRSAGTDTQKANWLPKIADGSAHFGVALNEHVSMREGAGFQATGGTLSGKSLFALEMASATHFITSDKAGQLYVVAMEADGVSQRILTTIDRTRDFSEISLENVEAEMLGQGDRAAADRTVALARILLAADTLGAAQVMLAKSVEYAKDRKQFGRVIGSFQAVKHLCAEMAAKLEPARALVWHAAYLFDTEPDKAALMACFAKSHISEVGTFVARTSTEVHGGMGFTDLVGLHYWFKRIGVNRQLFGSPERLREDAARVQGWV